MENEYTDLPKRELCLEILKRQGVTGSLLQHSLKVNKVAVLLGTKLVEKQELIDLQLLDRASLLHDLCKADASAKEHSEKAAELLCHLGYPKIAVAVMNHYLEFILDNKFFGWEDLLVYYADKRVEQDVIVTIDERLQFLKARYPEHASTIDAVKPKLKELEKQIFKHLSFNPEDLKDKIR